MSIGQKLRDSQDHIRNSGWRIKWIPWQEPGQAEYVHNTPLTLLTGFGGAALFFVSVYLLVFKHAQWPVLVVGLTGLVMIFLGRIYASINKQARWIYLTARCIDQDIQERHYPNKGNIKILWEYRLICVFTHNGSEYRVTPEASHIAGFQSRDLVQKYLNERIQPDGTCNLWVDPQNPLHAVFDKKQRI
ncbi:MAG: hypothetical protein ACYDGO_06720 [Smithellaceae bacterium]